MKVLGCCRAWRPHRRCCPPPHAAPSPSWIPARSGFFRGAGAVPTAGTPSPPPPSLFAYLRAAIAPHPNKSPLCPWGSQPLHGNACVHGTDTRTCRRPRGLRWGLRYVDPDVPPGVGADGAALHGCPQDGFGGDKAPMSPTVLQEGARTPHSRTGCPSPGSTCTPWAFPTGGTPAQPTHLPEAPPTPLCLHGLRGKEGGKTQLPVMRPLCWEH